MVFSEAGDAGVSKQNVTPPDDGGKKNDESQTSTRLYTADNDDLNQSARSGTGSRNRRQAGKPGASSLTPRPVGMVSPRGGRLP